MGTITCEPKALADALAAVKPAVNTRSAIKALSGVRINSGGGKFYVTGANLDTFLMRELPAAGASFDAVLPHKSLTDAVKLMLKRDTLTLTHCTHGGDEVHLSNGNRTIKLQTLRCDDFPAFPDQGGRVLLVANGRELARVLERASKFASRDETRPVLCGMNLTWQNGPMTLAATDSYRLGVFRVPGEQIVREASEPEQNNVTVRGDGLLILARLAAKLDAPVEILSNDRFTVANLPGMVVAIRNIDGTFPNWRQLFPDQFNYRLTVPVDQLADALQVAVKFCQCNAPVRLWMNGHVKLHGHTPDVGGFEEVLVGAQLEPAPPVPEEFEIGLNPEFLRDITQAYESETANVRLISPLRPAMFEDGDDRFLLMPIRLNV